MCTLHEVDVPLAHMPDHTWLGMSEEEWAVNLEMYATQPERFLQLQCARRVLVYPTRRSSSQLGGCPHHGCPSKRVKTTSACADATLTAEITVTAELQR